MHSTPLTRPIPVTIPAAGTLPSYMPSAARADNSRNGENGSNRASILLPSLLPESVRLLPASVVKHSRNRSVNPPLSDEEFAGVLCLFLRAFASASEDFAPLFPQLVFDAPHLLSALDKLVRSRIDEGRQD